jgi:hypothetical protein
MGLCQYPPLLMQTTRFLQDGGGLAEQDGIASEAKHKIGPAPMRDHVQHLWGRKMTVTTDEDVGVGPVATEIGQQTHQDHGIFGPCGAGTRPQVGGDERMGGAFENEQRQVAIVLIVMTIKGWILLDSRVVDLPMSYNPIVVTLSSLKPFLFNGLKMELCFSDHVGA